MEAEFKELSSTTAIRRKGIVDDQIYYFGVLPRLIARCWRPIVFMASKLLIRLTILIFSSCSTNKYVFNADRLQEIGQLTVDKATKRDLDNGHKDVSPNYLISIGESIYPNSKKFDLATPKSFEKISRGFRLTTEYYYTPSDRMVRVILYQWDKVGSGSQKAEFQKQFDQLRQSLTDKLGQPKEIEINQKEYNDETFRDGIKWAGEVNAYLFMFGNDRTEYRQIRLAIYRD
jgi:hypothetical protein